MNWQQHLKVSITNLMTSKLRTLLAMLGILVGTASVVAMVSSGQLAAEAALEQFKHLGTNLLSVNLFENTQQPSHKKNDLSLKQAEALSRKVTALETLAPYSSLYDPIYFNGKSFNGTIIGTTQDLKPAIRIAMLKGRFISFLDKNNFVCVLGRTLAGQLTPNPKTLIGQQIELGNHFLTIVGIAKPWPENSFFNQDINTSVILPVETACVLSRYAVINALVIRLHPKAANNIEQVKQSIQDYLNEVVPGKQIFFRSAEEIIKSMQSQKQILTILLGLIGSISLLVGGIGVMNIMLVSVAERRREIGIRRAIGAKQRDIQKMFLTEALILALLGGCGGVVLGIMISLIIALYAHWSFTIFILPPLIGFSVSVLVGIFFGFYPAYLASKLNPIETLRSE